MNRRIQLRVIAFVFLFVTLLSISYHIPPIFTVTNGWLPTAHEPPLVPKLETEIITITSEVKSRLPNWENGTVKIEARTHLPLSESSTNRDNSSVNTTKLKHFFDDTVKNKVSKLQWSGGEVKKKLPSPVIDHVKTFVFFLGHGRSGHSIVGSLMDSHPNMVIASEVDVFTRLSDGSLPPIKSEIFNALWANAKEDIMYGLRAKSTDGKGYNLFVDGLYEGRYMDHIDVIGDKKGGITTKLLATEPDKWSHVYDVLRSLNVTIKVIFVIRNPYDNIGTSLFYGLDSPVHLNKFGGVKESNNTYNFSSSTIQKIIDRYFLYHQTIADAKKKYHLNIIEIHVKDLISDPRGTLLNICNSLGVTCSDNYLDICSSKIFKTESRTRHLIRWSDEQLTMIQQNIEKYKCLKGYNFYSS